LNAGPSETDVIESQYNSDSASPISGSAVEIVLPSSFWVDRLSACCRRVASRCASIFRRASRIAIRLYRVANPFFGQI
jgi:hypothetical protein